MFSSLNLTASSRALLVASPPKLWRSWWPECSAFDCTVRQLCGRPDWRRPSYRIEGTALRRKMRAPCRVRRKARASSFPMPYPSTCGDWTFHQHSSRNKPDCTDEWALNKLSYFPLSPEIGLYFAFIKIARGRLEFLCGRSWSSSRRSAHQEREAHGREHQEESKIEEVY